MPIKKYQLEKTLWDCFEDSRDFIIADNTTGVLVGRMSEDALNISCDILNRFQMIFNAFDV